MYYSGQIHLTNFSYFVYKKIRQIIKIKQNKFYRIILRDVTFDFVQIDLLVFPLYSIFNNQLIFSFSKAYNIFISTQEIFSTLLPSFAVKTLIIQIMLPPTTTPSANKLIFHPENLILTWRKQETQYQPWPSFSCIHPYTSVFSSNNLRTSQSVKNKLFILLRLKIHSLVVYV